MLNARALLTPVRRTIRDTLRRYSPVLASRFSSFRLTEDRRLLERVILPYLSDDPSTGRLLFVGCDWYTKPYERLFADAEYWTLDIDASKRCYGARRHIADCLRNLERYVPPGYFDAIVCNGVFMRTAIETRDEAEPSFAACSAALKSGGWFILGWNDTVELRPYPPSESEELAKFAPAAFPPLGSIQVITDTSYRHTFTFFKKPPNPHATSFADVP